MNIHNRRAPAGTLSTLVLDGAYFEKSGDLLFLDAPAPTTPREEEESA